MLHALVIEDDPDFQLGLAELVKQEGFTVATAGSLKEAREQVAGQPPDLALIDLMLPDGEGIELLKDFRESRSDAIMVSGQATVGSAIEALRLGALDYLVKPIDIPRLKTVLSNVTRMRVLKEEIGTLRQELRRLGHFGALIGNSPEIQEVYDLVAKVAPTEATALIIGESGTGKEVVAQTICELSRRRHKPFVPINCGAISPTLIESELFGHERGSFTGADHLRRGHFERASGGTLLLDEITEMPVELQVKLLRVLETGTLMRVGGDEPIPVDLRLIAATNRPPQQAMAAGKLREDLFYRLNVFPIHLPPLRERQGDALLLADHFLERLNASEGTSKRFSPAARDRIRSHRWPGNVRELKNEVQKAFIMSEDVIEMDGLKTGHGPPPAPLAHSVPSPQPGASLAEVERRHILATLEQCGGDKKKASEVLGISLKTLYNRLNLYTRAASLPT
ncbi:MAG TPA: sigma-54 dependent transcriptional regulator [Candidatus Eisenbacteria bacterium]